MQSEEIVFRMQGILVHHNLPPVLQLPRFVEFPIYDIYSDTWDRRQDNIRYLRQAITLTGLGTHKFKAALEGIQMIHSIFSKEPGLTQLEKWSPGYFQEHHTTNLWNRYFTSSMQSGSHQPNIAFDKFVDPNGVLASVMGGHLMHTQDNHVEYYQRVEKSTNKFK